MSPAQGRGCACPRVIWPKGFPVSADEVRAACVQTCGRDGLTQATHTGPVSGEGRYALLARAEHVERQRAQFSPCSAPPD